MYILEFFAIMLGVVPQKNVLGGGYFRIFCNYVRGCSTKKMSWGGFCFLILFSPFFDIFNYVYIHKIYFNVFYTCTRPVYFNF